MKVLVIGGGGREHALAWKLASSPDVGTVYCSPGNGGISDIAQCLDLNLLDFEGVSQFCHKERIELCVVGPENPLAAGIADYLTSAGIPVFGPSAKGALIEASKIFAKTLMGKNAIPTAGFVSFDAFPAAKAYIEQIEPPYVIKADGLCAGKGAYVVHSLSEGAMILDNLMVREIYGEAGKKVIIEEFLKGIEASYIAFTDGKTVLPMLPSQDHKPLYDDDRGPNTGGMGAYTPIPFVDSELEKTINETIMEPVVKAMAQEGIVYKGALYGGLMLQGRMPYVIEFNARLGDPETQPLLFHMESDVLPFLNASVHGRLDKTGPILWKKGVSVSVVLASRGYPEKPEKGKIIHGLSELQNNGNVMVFHCGTARSGKDYVTSGGRVLAVTARGDTYKEAIQTVYDAVQSIHFDGMQYRKDIGKKALPSRICTGSGI